MGELVFNRLASHRYSPYDFTFTSLDNAFPLNVRV